MSDNNDFTDTIDWTTGESIPRTKKSKRIPTFYLVIGAIIVFLIIIILIYFMAAEADKNSLDMMVDSDYIYYSDDLGLDDNSDASYHDSQISQVSENIDQDYQSFDNIEEGYQSVDNLK